MSWYFSITKRATVEHNNSVLLASITLQISVIPTDHHQAHKNISQTHVIIHDEYY